MNATEYLRANYAGTEFLYSDGCLDVDRIAEVMEAYHLQAIDAGKIREMAEEIYDFTRREPDEHISGIEAILSRHLGVR